MKIYTNTFDLSQPSEKKFWVSPHSDFKIGISVLGYTPNNIELYKDGEKLTKSNSDGIFGYWKIKSEDTGVVEYTVKATRDNNVVGELSLVQVVTNSTVFDVSEGGGGSGGELPSEVEFTKVTVGTSIINEGDIECDDLETQIINSIVGEFTNLKTAEFTIGNTTITESNIILNDGGVSKIKTISQSDYDSLATKDANTLYVIVE